MCSPTWRNWSWKFNDNVLPFYFCIRKTNCDALTCLHINFTSYAKASFSSTCSTESTSVFLAENQINTKSPAVISWVSLVLGVSNKSSIIYLKFFNHIHLKKKLTFCSILLLFLISVIVGPFAMFLLYSCSCKCFVFECDPLSKNQLKCETSPSSSVFCHTLLSVLRMNAHLLLKG